MCQVLSMKLSRKIGEYTDEVAKSIYIPYGIVESLSRASIEEYY